MREEGIVAVLMMGSVKAEISSGITELATKGTCSWTSGSAAGGGYRSKGVVEEGWEDAGVVEGAEAGPSVPGEAEPSSISPSPDMDCSSGDAGS
jgi:hypothetical protein